MRRLFINCPSQGKIQDYVVIHYPGGEMQVRLPNHIIRALPLNEEVVVRATIQKPADIIELALLKSAIDGVGVQEKTTAMAFRATLLIPYFPYARADRRFMDGDCEGLGTMARLLFAMSFDKVQTLDAHSIRTHHWTGCEDLSAAQYITQAINSFALAQVVSKVQVLLPDKGAFERYSDKIVLNCGSNVHAIDVVNVLHASKKRDQATGALSGFEVPTVGPEPILIVDDICDGGGTFVGLAQEIAKQGSRPLGLYVTHGIFSKGLDPLLEYFENIYTTDSLPQGLHHRLEVLRIKG